MPVTPATSASPARSTTTIMSTAFTHLRVRPGRRNSDSWARGGGRSGDLGVGVARRGGEFDQGQEPGELALVSLYEEDEEHTTHGLEVVRRDASDLALPYVGDREEVPSPVGGAARALYQSALDHARGLVGPPAALPLERVGERGHAQGTVGLAQVDQHLELGL